MAVGGSHVDWDRANTSNSTGPNGTQPEPYLGAASILSNLPISVPTILTYAVCFLLGTVGNVLVVFSVARFRRLRSTTNYLLGNLATADLLIVALCVPVKAAEFFLPSWQLGGFLCKATALLQFLSVICSVLTLTCISIERYFAIIHPMQIRSVFTVRRARLLIAAIWVVSFLLASPALVSQTLVGYDWGTGEIVYHCQQVWKTDTHKQLYSVYGLVLLFVVPMATMALSYGRIIREILKRRWKVLRERQAAQMDDTRRGPFVRPETLEDFLALPHINSDLPTNTRDGGNKPVELDVGKINSGFQVSPRMSSKPTEDTDEKSVVGERKDSREEELLSDDVAQKQKSSKDLLRKYRSLPLELESSRRRERLQQRRNTDAETLDCPLISQHPEEPQPDRCFLDRLLSFRRKRLRPCKPRTSLEATDDGRPTTRRTGRVTVSQDSSVSGNFYKSTHVLADGEGIRILRMLVTVVVIFAFCWGPKLILLTLKNFDLVNEHTKVVYALDIAFQLLTYLNSCVNPVCYAFMSRHFRQCFKDTISSGCNTRNGTVGRQGTPDILQTTKSASRRGQLDITATVCGLTETGTTMSSRVSSTVRPSRFSVSSYGRTSTTVPPQGMYITTVV